MGNFVEEFEVVDVGFRLEELNRPKILVHDDKVGQRYDSSHRTQA